MARGEETAEARVHSRAGGFTVIDNGIFRDRNLSLKAKGLLCTVMSLPREWDYSIRGLLKIVNPTSEDDRMQPLQGQGRDGIYATLKELEERGYLVREQVRGDGGTLGKLVYHFYDTPQVEPSGADGNLPSTARAEVENRRENPRSAPLTEKPYTAEPYTVNPTQLNTKGNKVLNSINHSPATRISAQVQGAGGGETEESDGFERAFDALCAASLKRPCPSSLAAARKAYRDRIRQGYGHEQIARAYRAYVRRYREHNDDTRYAKQLADWLVQSDGLAWDAGKPENQRAHADALRRGKAAAQEEERLLSAALKERDPAYREMSAELMALVRQSVLAQGERRRALAEEADRKTKSMAVYLRAHWDEAKAALRAGEPSAAAQEGR